MCWCRRADVDPFRSFKKGRIDMAAKTVVFVHGMYMTPLCWEQWMDRFHSKGYQCLAPAWPGSESRQAKFSVCDHFAGSPVSALMPLFFGPRDCGQFSARAAVGDPTSSAKLNDIDPTTATFVCSNDISTPCSWGNFLSADPCDPRYPCSLWRACELEEHG